MPEIVLPGPDGVHLWGFATREAADNARRHARGDGLRVSMRVSPRVISCEGTPFTIYCFRVGPHEAQP